MAEQSLGSYCYETLTGPTAFRVVELLPGKADAPVSCLLYDVQWRNLRDYEAISYAWGDPTARVPIMVHGQTIEVTKSLHAALIHLRYEDRSRFLWVDAIWRSDIPERGAQVKQMRRIYESAKSVLIWLGPDNETNQASLAINSVTKITSFLCQKLGISPEDLASEDEVYHEIVFKNRDRLPHPQECDFITEKMWEALLWLYKHPYFTRVWAIQEINANKNRIAHCGREIIQWDPVELVAGYIILETAFSKSHGFSVSYCWWASTAPSELRQARNWLHMLYLASNFAATDSRDVIYGLRGMMKCEEGGELLDPDYSKSTLQVYRDVVEVSFINFKTTNVLLYVSGVEDPSWIPRWDEPMLFRNPFRFGKQVPWKPAGKSLPLWSIDKDTNILSLCGIELDPVKSVEPYNETFFGSLLVTSNERKSELQDAWKRILGTIARNMSIPFSDGVLAASAVSFSFGLDDLCNPADEQTLFRNFVAYLKNVLDEETYNKYVSLDTSHKCKNGQGDAFGKPVWDFKYPVSSFFITEGGLIGCSIAVIQAGDILFIPLGCVYPLILRPENDQFHIKGFCFVHGIMHGEKQESSRRTVEIC